MCDCFHLAFPNWHADSSGTGAGGRRLRGPEPGTEDDSVCDEPPQFTEGERPRPQGSSPVEEFPETRKFTDSDKECEVEHDPRHKSGTGKKSKKSGLGSMFEKRSTPRMSKLKELPSPESGVIVKTAKDGCAEGLIYGGGGKEGLFIKEVVPESPASKSLKLREGDQVLSATVYFDNVPYEDAIQILEHAQAYKVKLCLKRKPDITETEPAMDSDVFPEEELCAPEMREQGKTKRRGDARISWPKFPSFGKGRKSRFTRSHSSSEADEQRKLELSPTTSDTESPIKSQDALKGKKRHKMKLSVLTKRGRISSSEDQDTEVPTTGQTSGDIHQTVSDMLSPECLESLSGQTPEVFVTEDLRVVEEIRLEQNDQRLTDPQSVQHKAELISIDGTLKTEDLTVALADQQSPPGIRSPKEKKSKKERSQLKMKILGKEKSHKKDAKAKASPKRLKTLGASIETADQAVNEKSDAIPEGESQTQTQRDNLPLDVNTQIISGEAQPAKSATTQKEISLPTVELGLSDATFMRKSQKQEQAKKDDVKQKQETTFKLPKLGFSDISTEETIQIVNVEECPKMKLKSDGPAVKGDPYDILSKSSHSRAQLPKREDIEIPGMEDMAARTKAKGIKEPKVGSAGHYEKIHSDSLQMLIDVDSVKEAVSKLPGFKLPKVDISGIPIPEEITVIDANAQRISVKTPTKVADTKSKYGGHLTKVGITASPEIKLPKIAAASTSEDFLIETKVDFQTPKKICKTEVYKREDIIIPGKESEQGTVGITFQSAALSSPKESSKKSSHSKITMASSETAPVIQVPDIGIDFTKQNNFQEGDTILGRRTIVLQDKTPTTETSKGKTQVGEVISDVKMPDIDTIEYIDSVSGSPAKMGIGMSLTGCGVHLDVTKPKTDIKVETGVRPPGASEVNVTLEGANVSLPQQRLEVEKPRLEIKPLHTDTEPDGQGSKFKMPKFGIKMPKIKGPQMDISLPKKDMDVTIPEAKAEVKLPEAPDVDITLGSIDVSVPEQKLENEKPKLEIKPLTTDVELDGQGRKFKMPKFGMKMPKVKGPQLDISLPKKDMDVTIPEGKAEVKLPEAPDVDITLGSIDVSVPEQKLENEKPKLEIKPPHTDIELDRQGSKFKMPKFGIKMPKIKGPQLDIGLPKKDMDITIPEGKAEVKLPEAPDTDVTLGNVEISVPEKKLVIEKPELEIKQAEVELDGQGSKFKMPKFGMKMPKVKGPELDLSLQQKEVDVKQPKAKAEVKLPEAPEVDMTLGSIEVSVPVQKIEVEKPELEIKPPHTDMEVDGEGSKFKMPKFGIKMPKIKGTQLDISLPKKDMDITLPEGKAEVKLPEAPDVDITLGSIDVSVPEQKLVIEKPELEIKQAEVELDGQGSKFKMPKFGMKMPKVKGPELDISLPQKDMDVTIPEGKVEVKLQEAPEVDISLGSIEVSVPVQKIEVEKPEVEIKPLTTDVELDGQGRKFKMPKFGMKMPKVKGPELDLSMPKKDIDVKQPKAKAEVKLPEAPEVDMTLGSIEVSVPVQKIEVEKPEVEIKPPHTDMEVDGEGSKFKMPKFGIKMPKIKGPQLDISLPKKDMDVTIPEGKAEVKLPEAPDIDVTLGNVEVSVPEQNLVIEKPELEIKQAEVELDGQGSKFKMPKFGMKMTKVKGPEDDISMSKKDADIKLSEAKLPDIEQKQTPTEFNAPEIEAHLGSVKGSPSKFKLPTFKFPKFGVSTPAASADVPDTDTNVKAKIPEVPEFDVNLGKAEVSLPEGKLEVQKPEVEIKPLKSGGQGSKFKMPKIGMSVPKVKGPEIDISISKKDVDVKLPEAEAEVHLPDVELREPSAKVEVKSPEIEIQSSSMKGSPSKFKLPTFKFPKFGVAVPDISAKVPDTDKDIKVEAKIPEVPDIDINIGEAKLSLPEGKLEVQKPEMEIKPLQTEVEFDEHGSKFKMPKIGMSMPKVKGPEIDISISKKDVDVKLAEAEAEVHLPDVELREPSAEVEVKSPEIEIQSSSMKGSPSKFKLPTFKFPKFGVAVPDISAKVPDTDKDIKVEAKIPEVPDIDINIGEAKLSLPEGKLEVQKPEMEIKPLQTEVEFDEHGSKFKMPKIGMSMPKVKGPEIDISISKKDVDVKLPEAEAEVHLPDVELKEPSAEVKVKAPEIEVQSSSMKESPSKFKLPTFKFPKFGVSTQTPSAEVPDTDTNIKAKIPEFDPEFDVNLGKAEVSLPEGKLKVQKPEMEIKPLQAEVEFDGHGSKFKMPKIGMSMPKVKGPEIDISISKKDVDVKLAEAEAEVHLPDVELREPSAKVEVKSPEIEIQSSSMKGSPSKFKLPTFKFPKFGVAVPDISAKVPDTDKDIKVEAKIPEVPDIDINIGETKLSLPEGKLEVQKPEMEIKPLQTEVEFDEHGSKFKMPKIGMSMPKVKGPDIDISISKKDVDVKLPEAEAEVHLPDVELKEPSAEVEVKAPEIEVQSSSIKESPSKFKLPTFKFPKFGVSTQTASAEVPDTDTNIKAKIPEFDVNLGKAEVSLPEGKLKVQKPEMEIKPLQAEVEFDGHGSKFKMPKIGMSMPKVKGPEIDISISKKDVDVKLAEAEAEVHLPDVELKEPSAEVEVKAPEIEIQSSSMKGSPSKFKLPTFKFPKFGVSTQTASAEVPDTDTNIKAKIPEFDPEFDVNLGKAEVSLPEGKLKVQKPEMEIKPLQAEVEFDGHGSKFKMPKIGMSMPKVKGPEIDISISKKDVDVKLAEAETEVHLPDVELREPSAKVEVKSPEIEIQSSSMKGSPSKFKLPTFKFPKFGVAVPDISAKVPDTDKDIKVEAKIPEVPDIDINIGEAKLSLPEGKLEVQKPEMEIKPLQTEVEFDEHGSKFKMPKIGMSMPKVKGPDIDIRISKKDVDVKLAEAEAEVHLPDVELKEPSAEVEVKAPEIEIQSSSMKESPSKFKLPTFKFPKFGVSTQTASAEVPDTDTNIKAKIPEFDPEFDVNLGKAEVSLPEEKLKVQKPEMEIKPLQAEVEFDGHGSKFKMPKIGMSMPKVKGPEIDISISKKDVDVELPEAEAEVHLPDVELREPSAEVEVKSPEIEVQSSSMKGSPSKFKLPTFKFPKFGVAVPDVSSELPNTDKEIKIDGAHVDISVTHTTGDFPEVKTAVSLPGVEIKEPVGSVEIEKPELEIKQAEGELDGQGRKFKMPRFGMKMPKVKGPELDLSMPKKDIDVTLPKAKAEVRLPEAPEVDITLGGIDVSVPEQMIEVEKPEVEIKPPHTDIELDGQGSKFKMPKFGIKMPKIKGPQLDISLPKKDMDVTIPEGKAEVKLPEAPDVDITLGSIDVSVPEQKLVIEKPELEIKQAEVELDGQGSKFKMPKFGMKMSKVKGPAVDTSMSKKDADIKLPESKVEVSAPQTTGDFPEVKAAMSLPGVEINEPVGGVVIEKQSGIEVDAKVKKPRFSLPKFSFSKPTIKAAEVASHPDIDVSLPEGNMEIVPPEVGFKLTGGDVELDGQESKFEIPKYGITVPKLKGTDLSLDVDVSLPKDEGKAKVPEVSETDIDLSTKGVDIKLPEVKTRITLPDVEVEERESSAFVLDAPTVETEAKMKRPNWTFPKFSFSKTGSKAADVDINVESVEADVTLPEAKAELHLPEVDIKGPSGITLMEDPPNAELDTNLKKSKFSLPKMSFSKSSTATPKVSAELPRVDVSLEDGEVIVKQPQIEIKSPELESQHSVQGSKFKIPKFGIVLPKAKGPEVDLSTLQKDVDITLPEVKAEVKLPEVEVKESAASVETDVKDVGGSPLKFKMPTLKMPKFGGVTHDVTIEAPEADKAEISSAKLEEDITVKIKGPSVDVTAVGLTDSGTPVIQTDDMDHGSPSRFKLPSFKLPSLSFSRPKPEEENVPGEVKEDQPETAGETKSPKLTLISFGQMLKNMDVEFDVSQPDKEEENLEKSEPSGNQLDGKDTNQGAARSPEKTGWFKFPRFGLSSPSEPIESFEKDEQRDEKSPVGDEISPTSSFQSSDAFADISSTVTSENIGVSISSPTKVTVKYSDPNGATELEEIHSKVITSTAKTEMISIEPNLPEKITILSSGVSSSSEDTVKLESGKIHIVSSNIQATPEAQHAKLFSSVQFQSAGGLPLKSEADEAASWTVEDSQSGRRTVFERHVMREKSSERSESKETIVITKQVTHIFDSSEPISGETASSIQRLKDTVHTEKMRFFDGAEK